MSFIQKISWILCLILFGVRVHAQSIQLQSISQDDFSKVVGDMSANFLHTSVSGASTLGSIFGFEIGVVGGQTSTPNLNDVVSNVPPKGSATAKTLPHGEILGVLTVPFGITGEFGLVPKVGNDSFKFNSMSIAVKWTPTETLLSDWPLSVAIKGSYTKSTADFSQTVNNATMAYSLSDTETFIGAFVSKNLGIVEPYFGAGMVNAKADLSATGSVPLYSYTSSQSDSLSRSTTAWMVGAELKLLVVKLGAEYTSLFNTNRISGKLSFFF